MKWYAGIGSRRTPPDVLRTMMGLALALDRDGYTCRSAFRSGGADGADKAFEVASKILIMRPGLVTLAAEEIASQFHPAWHNCGAYVRMLHGRNAQIILGYNLNEPAEFVVCWTDDPPNKGGTQMGIRIAEAYGIDVRNLIDPFYMDWAEELISE